MPTYGYRCPACDTEFDVWQKMSDPVAAACPACGAAAKRMFFPAGIVFKGTGFYATDSRRPSTASANGAGSGDKSAAKTSDSASSGSASPAPSPSTSANGASPSGSSSSSTSTSPS